MTHGQTHIYKRGGGSGSSKFFSVFFHYFVCAL